MKIGLILLAIQTILSLSRVESIDIIGGGIQIIEAGWTKEYDFQTKKAFLRRTYSQDPVIFYMRVEIDRNTFRDWNRSKGEFQVPLRLKLFRKIGFSVRRESVRELELYTGNLELYEFLSELEQQFSFSSVTEIIVFAQIDDLKPGLLIASPANEYLRDIPCQLETCMLEIEVLR